MPRKPKDDVAASTTITLRLTPDDRRRIERQIKARSAELPEPSISALLRRLVRDGEDALLIRLSVEDRELLGRLVSERVEQLAKLGAHEAHVTEASVIVTLIREAAKTRGFEPSSVPHATEAAPAAEQPKSEQTAKSARSEGAPSAPRRRRTSKT